MILLLEISVLLRPSRLQRELLVSPCQMLDALILTFCNVLKDTHKLTIFFLAQKDLVQFCFLEHFHNKTQPTIDFNRHLHTWNSQRRFASSRIGAPPLGLRHWGFAIGTLPLGLRHWDFAIGASSRDNWGLRRTSKDSKLLLRGRTAIGFFLTG